LGGFFLRPVVAVLKVTDGLETNAGPVQKLADTLEWVIEVMKM
jgi:hypothetical protein